MSTPSAASIEQAERLRLAWLQRCERFGAPLPTLRVEHLEHFDAIIAGALEEREARIRELELALETCAAAAAAVLTPLTMLGERITWAEAKRISKDGP